jgi:hypothetical protein
LVISHEILAERGYFKVPHLGHWFILVRFVNFICFTLRSFQFTNFIPILLFFFFFHFSPKTFRNCTLVLSCQLISFQVLFFSPLSPLNQLFRFKSFFFKLQSSPLTSTICKLVHSLFLVQNTCQRFIGQKEHLAPIKWCQLRSKSQIFTIPEKPTHQKHSHRSFFHAPPHQSPNKLSPPLKPP